MKRTPLWELHREKGAKFVPFADFEMPLQYEGIIKEHRWVRQKVGLFDVSHMGEIEITGPRSLEFVSYIISNNPALLEIFGIQYSVFVNHKGGIVDDLLVYRLPDHFLLVINATNIEKDFKWVKSHLFKEGVEAKNLSDSIAELALQGPDAQKVLQPLVDIDLENINYYHAAECKVFGVDALISRTGYTGEDGFEIYLEPKDGIPIAKKLLENPSVKMIGLGARDTLRFEMGYCLYGNDIDDDTSPWEARLGWVVKMDKGDFVGKDALIKQKEKGIKKYRVGFITEKKSAIPRPHQSIFSSGNDIGHVTSGTFSPSLNQGIGMGYVLKEFSKRGTKIEIEIRGHREKAEIVSLPFYKMGTVRK